MDTIADLIKKQAMAIKAKSDNLTIADHYEALAKLHRAQASAPVKLDFKAIAQAKRTKVEKFGEALRKLRERDIQQALTSAGWALWQTEKTTGIRSYLHQQKRNSIIKISGDKFSVTLDGVVKVQKQDLSFLPKYLDPTKKI